MYSIVVRSSELFGFGVPRPTPCLGIRKLLKGNLENQLKVELGKISSCHWPVLLKASNRS